VVIQFQSYKKLGSTGGCELETRGYEGGQRKTSGSVRESRVGIFWLVEGAPEIVAYQPSQIKIQ
jgi:hypothetical protein